MTTKFQVLKHNNDGARVGIETRDMVKNLKWVTDLSYSAGELTFDTVNGKDPMIPTMGTIVDFAWNNRDIFWGFVFDIECTSDTIVSVKVHDSEGYLKSEGSVVFQSGTFGDRHSNVYRRLGVSLRIKEQPACRVPAEAYDGKTGLDMTKNVIDKIYSATDEMYYIVANHMYIELRRVSTPTRIPLVIDTQNTMNDYTYSESTGNAASVAQIVQKSADNSQTKTVTVTSDIGGDPVTTSSTIVPTRGNTIRTREQIAEVVNAKNKANWAQMVRQANDELKKRSVSERKLALGCIGDISLTAGAGANVKTKDSSKTQTNYPILRATHNFETDYICSLEMKAGTEW